MEETPNGIEQQVEDLILASFAQEGNEQQETTAQDETGEKRIIDVDLYRLENGAVLLVPGNAANPLDTNAVESGAPAPQQQVPGSETPPIPLVEDEQPEPAASTSTKRWVKRSFVLVPLMLLCLLAAGTASYWYLLPLTATATVTITPKARGLHTDTTLTIATHPKAGQVQGRPLEGMSFTKTKTVPATGHAHDDATSAAGVLTFYNADSQGYTIPAGETFTTPNGQTAVTDTTVTVQAAVLPEVGIAISAAHVIQAGRNGNIAAHTIDTRCCGSEFITATNTSAFSGGMDARTYSFIQSSDIQNASSNLVTSLTSKATAALQQQARLGEQLVTPLCTSRTTSSQDPGAEGASVTVSVTQTCTSVAYALTSLQQVATSTLAQMANPHYQQEGAVQVTVNGSTYADQTALLNVSLSGAWVYHFTQAQLAQFTHHIAGDSQQQAKVTLAKGDGVASVSIHVQRLDFKDLLPTDPQHIKLLIVFLVP